MPQRHLSFKANRSTIVCIDISILGMIYRDFKYNVTSGFWRLLPGQRMWNKVGALLHVMTCFQSKHVLPTFKGQSLQFTRASRKHLLLSYSLLSLPGNLSLCNDIINVIFIPLERKNWHLSSSYAQVIKKQNRRTHLIKSHISRETQRAIKWEHLSLNPDTMLSSSFVFALSCF